MNRGQVQAADLRGTSAAERGFALRWSTIPRAPELQREVRFDSNRRWRFDFANAQARVAVEIEGGAWSGGRHTRGGGFIEDCAKYNAAALQGWTVFRLTPDMARDRTRLETIADFIRLRLNV
jgi:very-short-patch-repair endonuclease